MTLSVDILADSVSPNDIRLTTFQMTLPRIVLAELNTHRTLSRNSASSRAIPVSKMLEMVHEHPYVPEHWGQNQSGMQAGEALSHEQVKQAREVWLAARDQAAMCAQALLNIGLHKQLTNRLLEPFMWHTVIITATELSNFLNLRDNPAAHPDIHAGAHMLRVHLDASSPKLLSRDQWHLPLVPDFDQLTEKYSLDEVRRISIARCARVSYLTHDGVRAPEKDLELHDRLLSAGHMSPFEHVARPMSETEWGLSRMFEILMTSEDGTEHVLHTPTPLHLNSTRMELLRETHFCGNFNGWVQHRKLIKNEYDIMAPG